MAEAKTLHITQVRSQIGRPADQGKTLKALGLGKIGRTVEQADTPSIRGMIDRPRNVCAAQNPWSQACRWLP